jgi:hypothetical protein
LDADTTTAEFMGVRKTILKDKKSRNAVANKEQAGTTINTLMTTLSELAVAMNVVVGVKQDAADFFTGAITFTAALEKLPVTELFELQSDLLECSNTDQKMVILGEALMSQHVGKVDEIIEKMRVVKKVLVSAVEAAVVKEVGYAPGQKRNIASMMGVIKEVIGKKLGKAGETDEIAALADRLRRM